VRAGACDGAVADPRADGAGVSAQPPTQLTGDDPAATTPTAAAPTPAVALPTTGADPRVLFLAGVALMLLGAGLRLRTADADVL
jgi:LPXTG-motif cell wall-anchored protein